MSELRAGTPVAVAGVTLIPIERVGAAVEMRGRGLWFTGVKEPIAVVILRPGSACAVAVDGEARSISELVVDVPGLEALLEGH